MTSSSGNIGYEKTLAEVAKEVDRLVMRNPVMDYFREKIRPLGLCWQDYVSDCNRAGEKYIMHWEKVKANPAWRDKNAGPPQEGWEWAPYYLKDLDDGPGYNVPAKLLPEYMAGLRKWINRNEQKLKGLEEKGCDPSSHEYRNVQGAVSEQKSELADVQSKLKHQDISSTWVPVPWGWWGYLEDLGQEDVFGCWRPPEQEIAENPLSNLVAEGPDTALPRPKDKAEEYERYYVILTSIHDNKLPECGKIDNNMWPQELAESVWFRLTDAQPYGPSKHFVEAALERVKVDIEEKLMSVSKKPAVGHNMTNMEKAKQLCEIAGRLTQLDHLKKSKADADMETRRKALTSLFENWPLIADAERAYPLHPFLGQLFTTLKNRAAQWRTLDLADCTELDAEFAKRSTGGAEHPSFIDELHRWADEIEQEKEQQEPKKLGETAATAASATGNSATPKEMSKDTYCAINLASRTVTIGEHTYEITSEPVWGFLKTLVDNKKYDKVTPRRDGHNDWKNAIDMLRRQVGKMGLHRVVLLKKGLYYLDPSVKLRGGSQVAIRKTKQRYEKHT
jgi:hypothetical protein